MRSSLGIGALVAGVLAVAVAYIAVLLPGAAPSWPAWGVAAGTCLMLFGLLDLGARRREGRPAVVRLVFAGTALWVALGFVGLLASPVPDLDTPFFLGLPLPAAWMIWVLGVGPALFLPLAWAALFRSATLSDDAIERLHEARRQREERERSERRADAEGPGA